MLKMELPGKRKVKNKVYGISKRSTKNERKMKKMTMMWGNKLKKSWEERWRKKKKKADLEEEERENEEGGRR